MANKAAQRRGAALRSLSNDPDTVEGMRAVRRGDQVVYVPEDTDPRLFDEDALGEENVIDAALAGVLLDLGAADNDAKVTVSKIINDNGVRKEAFLYECHPNSFSQGDLQEAYGPGDYRIKVYGLQLIQGSKRRIIHANPKITIGPTREQARKAADPSPAVATVAPAHAGTDPALAAILGQLVSEVKQLRAAPAPSRTEILEELRAMADMFRPASAPASGGIDELQRAVALAAAMRGAFGGGGDAAASDPESAPWQMAMAAMREFGPILRAKMGAPDIAGTAAVPVPQAPLLRQPERAAQSAEQPPEDDEMKIFLAAQLALLLIAARGSDNPQKWGERIYDDAPPEILRLIHGATWFEELCKIEPAFSTFRPWLEKVRAVILAEIAAVGGIEAATSDAPAADPVLTGAAEGDTKAASVVPGAASVAAVPKP